MVTYLNNDVTQSEHGTAIVGRGFWIVVSMYDGFSGGFRSLVSVLESSRSMPNFSLAGSILVGRWRVL